MIDFAKITVKAGDGGEGAGSFRHIKGKRRGKADGGSGGNGGNVLICATYDMNTLEPYRFVKDYFAKNGVRGAPNLRKGADADDLVLKVPVGTQVKVSNVTEESKEPKVVSKPLDSLAHLEHMVLYDLVEDGQKVLVARGGVGGRGNAYMRDEYGRRPLRGEKGETGESANATLELKLIADIGLIGLPNSGKSTLLSVLTSAKPKVASYPFTTLEPNLGVLPVGHLPFSNYLPFNDYSNGKLKNRQSMANGKLKMENIVLADIPGLIEGASRGRGLGDLFLRHIERTKILVHLIDVSEVPEVPKVPKVSKEEESRGADLWKNYQTIRNELKNYSKVLVKKPEIVVLTKSDLISKDAAQSLLKAFKLKRKRVVLVSSKSFDGLNGLVKLILSLKS